MLIKFKFDTIIYPNESTWFGDITPDGQIRPMEETQIFKENTFGLKTLRDQGRIFKDEVEGGHLQIS